MVRVGATGDTVLPRLLPTFPGEPWDSRGPGFERRAGTGLKGDLGATVREAPVERLGSGRRDVLVAIVFWGDPSRCIAGAGSERQGCRRWGKERELWAIRH